MKNLFLLIVLLVSMASQSQVSKVYLQASGLTCSMCSKSIDKALKTLDFIEKVDADVKNYTFEISFKANSYVDFDKIRRR
jgi:copper chaperone CopZ